ncbi:MAG TPA: hypothetical protein VMG58_10725 [Candidatus Sulfotelmatobacter sp.]|nr:hypothetical protein [Candidatus Sulfotelmatobacter sp.]
MRKCFGIAAGVLALAFLAQTQAQEKPATRTLKVKLGYTGSGKVDANHKIFVFLFDSPDFVQGGVMPIASQSASAKDATLEFPGLEKSPIFVVAAFDPSGGYDGQSGPPPSGSSMGMYSTTPGQPEGVKIEPGKTVQIDLPFDDSFKMP